MTKQSGEINEITSRLAEAEEVLRAIRSGEVDAIVVSGAEGNQIFTISSAETPYLSFIEEMSEGAATLSKEGIILFCNRKLAEFVNEPIEQVVGSSFRGFILPDDQSKFDALQHQGIYNGQDEVRLISTNANHEPIYLKLAVSPLPPLPHGNIFILIATDISLLKKKEKESRRIQEQFGIIFEQAPLGIALVDSISGQILHVNKRYAEIVGRTPEEVVTSDWMSITHPNDLQEDIDNMARLNAGEITSFRMNKRYFRPDGSVIWISLTVSSIKDEENSRRQHLGMIEDITDRVQKEELIASKIHLIQFSVEHSLDELLAELLNEAEKLTGSLISFIAFVRDDQESLKTQVWSERTKTQFCQWEGKGLHNLIPEAGVWTDCFYQRKPVIHNDYASLTHRKGVPDGHPALTRELLVPIFRGEKIAAILGVGNKHTDYIQSDVQTILLLANLAWEIAQRMMAQQELKDSQLKYSIVADNAYDWEFWRAPDGRYLYQSPSCQRITGYPAEDFINDTEFIVSITHPDDRESFEQHRQSVITDPKPSKAEFRIITNEGAVRWIDHVCQPVFDADGKFMGTRGSNRDITDRKSAEQEIQQLNQTLEERVTQRTEQLEGINNELESFSYSISHDLRAPLRAISGFSQILSTRHRESLNEQGRQYMDYIVEASLRMDQLINDLLDYSRLGRRSLNLRPIPLSEIIDNIFTDFESRLHEIGAKIFIDKELPKIWGDESLLRQIFSNLIENAITYRRKDIQLEIIITCEPNDKGYILKITDNGIGIPQEYREKIFSVFQRLHSEEEYPGTGIGLATVRKALSLLHGSIRVESVVGAGSTFIINLNQ